MFLEEDYLNFILDDLTLSQSQTEFIQHYLHDMYLHEHVWYDQVNYSTIRILSKASSLILADITYDLLNDTLTLYFPVRDLTITEKNPPGGIGFSDETVANLFVLVAEGLISDR